VANAAALRTISERDLGALSGLLLLGEEEQTQLV
jgi:hypothetical protein